jgi:hypothetical protein
MTMTEAEYVEKLPIIGEWPADYRARFTVAANDLNFSEIPVEQARDLSLLVGVIMLAKSGDQARIVQRAAAVRMLQDAGAPPEVWIPISRPGQPNYITTLCFTPFVVVAFDIPMLLHRCADAGLQ